MDGMAADVPSDHTGRRCRAIRRYDPSQGIIAVEAHPQQYRHLSAPSLVVAAFNDVGHAKCGHRQCALRNIIGGYFRQSRYR